MAAGKEVEPPQELIKYWDWKDTGTPPTAGGLDDQPAGLLRRAKYLEAVYHIMQRWYKDSRYKMSVQELEIFKRVLQLRKERSNGSK